MQATSSGSVFQRAVIISALGYFVDIYDLVLFSIVRVNSLKSLGLSESAILEQGVVIIDMQMLGMLLGGILWGVLGDKKGRLSVLFGSILLYSLANIANAFVTSVEMYKWLRFAAGVGLAGELGAAITLVSEVLPKEKRGYGTSLVAGVGVSGAIAAAIVAQVLSWQAAYIVGGVLGLGLLVLRYNMLDSEMFHKAKVPGVMRGNFLWLFTSWSRFKRYAACILIGMPTWYIIGILVTLSPEIAKALGVAEPVSGGTAILFAYLGLVFGDFGSGLLSQWFRSRKKIVLGCVLALCVITGVYLNAYNVSATMIYTILFVMGLAAGYWAIFVQIGAEQFGTNMRATVATTVPNFVRGALVLLNAGFKFLIPSFGILAAAGMIGAAAMGCALFALLGLRETFDDDLDFLELP